MIKSLKTLILLLLCVSVASTSCKKKKTTPAAPTFDQLSLADIKAQDAAFSDPAITGDIYYNDPAEMRTFKVGSILFLKNFGPTLHYAKLEILSVSGTQLVFNYMAYSDTGAEMVSKKQVTITAGIDDFASWTGLHNADPATSAINFQTNPKTIIKAGPVFLLVAQP